MDGPWTLAELTAKAASALSDGRSAPPSGRVRDLPGERTIRWYVTIGLVDPPLSRRGRIAVYGPRHLLQLVAIKRRQAEGRSLADIQAELTGATDATLQRIARLDPLDLPAASRAETAAAPPPAPGERPSAPGAPTPGEAAPQSAADGTGSERVTDGSRPERLGGGPAPGHAARRFWAERPVSPPGRGPMPRGSVPAPDAPSADGAPGTAGTRGVAPNGADDAFDAISAPDAGGLAAAGAKDVHGALEAGDAGRAVAAAPGAADATDAPGTDDVVGATGAGDTGGAVAAARGATGASGALVRGVRLAPGVTLLLDSSPSPDDATAIVAAATPLLDLLSERGLL